MLRTTAAALLIPLALLATACASVPEPASVPAPIVTPEPPPFEELPEDVQTRLTFSMLWQEMHDGERFAFCLEAERITPEASASVMAAEAIAYDPQTVVDIDVLAEEIRTHCEF